MINVVKDSIIAQVEEELAKIGQNHSASPAKSSR
jgi:hypothetical protein